MPGVDVIEGSILVDGTIKSSTDSISAPNHAAAEAFFRVLAQLTGGTATRRRRVKQGTVHVHEHDHEHSHA